MEEEEEEEEGDKYYVDYRELYTNGIKRLRGSSNPLVPLENPFSMETFPQMSNIKYDEETRSGTLVMTESVSPEDYERMVAEYRRTRYSEDNTEVRALNENVGNITGAKLYNIVTGQKIQNVLDLHLNGDTSLVIKVVDLGYLAEEYKIAGDEDEAGNKELSQIYNEIRIAFFLNELRYAYRNALTHHFMIVVDWFVSDINLYPRQEGIGPYQYIVSERLDRELMDYLLEYPDMTTLKATLFCIAQALEAAWATHRYIHYDLHRSNVMLKNVFETSFFHNKNYLYQRVYSADTYRVPREGLHNTIVKIIDFGTNRMRIPSMPKGSDKLDLYEHIGPKGNHKHDEEIVYRFDGAGQGVGENRTWDIRRLLWDFLVYFPRTYWVILKEEAPKDYDLILRIMRQFIDVFRLNSLSREKGYDTQGLFRPPNSKVRGPITIEDILMSHVRDLYHTFRDGKDPYYEEIRGDIELRLIYRSQLARRVGYDNQWGSFDQLLVHYSQWELEMRQLLVWNKTSLIMTDATTFLSSELFDDFIIPINIVNENDAWMGQRPSDKVLLPSETY